MNNQRRAGLKEMNRGIKRDFNSLICWGNMNVKNNCFLFVKFSNFDKPDFDSGTRCIIVHITMLSVLLRSMCILKVVDLKVLYEKCRLIE